MHPAPGCFRSRETQRKCAYAQPPAAPTPRHHGWRRCRRSAWVVPRGMQGEDRLVARCDAARRSRISVDRVRIKMRSPGAVVALGAIRLYKKIPRLRPPVCRFDPTCSTYALTAIERFGLVKGVFFATRRIVRCHPWGGTGWDPVPPTKGSVTHG